MPESMRAIRAPDSGRRATCMEVIIDSTVRRLPLTVSGADLWLVDLSVEPTSSATLSEAERVRAGRFVFEADRRRYRAAHVALRGILAGYIEADAAEIDMLFGPNDKPYASAARGCVFNMSHSGELALIAVARGLPDGIELGVDIEASRAVSDASALARANFTGAEQAELAGCPPDERNRLFLSGWTRKEACLKAVGSGLSIAPSTFECGLAPRPATVCIYTAAGQVSIEVESIAVADDYIAALAITKLTQ